MIDLKLIKHVFVYPGKTDFRFGINRLRQYIGTNPLPQSLYVFCNSNSTQIKIIEIEDNAIRLYQKKLLKKKFMFPQKGDKASLTTKELEMIIEGVNLINKIENSLDSKKTDFY